ncbi:hypothetical protein C0989_004852 [Termitomyces sp. Mn162]|nr:hypothetical protein C0989_004852 [Termitomyces sp. Mn162]
MLGGSHHNLIKGDQGRVVLSSPSGLPLGVEGFWVALEVLALGLEMSESKIDWRQRGMAAAKLALGPGNCMVIVKGEGVVMVLGDSCHGRASIKELELKGFVKVIASEVKLTADKGAGGTTVNKGREYLGQAIESDIDDE